MTNSEPDQGKEESSKAREEETAVPMRAEAKYEEGASGVEVPFDSSNFAESAMSAKTCMLMVDFVTVSCCFNSDHTKLLSPREIPQIGKAT